MYETRFIYVLYVLWTVVLDGVEPCDLLHRLALLSVNCSTPGAPVCKPGSETPAGYTEAAMQWNNICYALDLTSLLCFPCANPPYILQCVGVKLAVHI